HPVSRGHTPAPVSGSASSPLLRGEGLNSWEGELRHFIWKMIQWNEEEETKPKVASEEWWFQAPIDGLRDSVELRPEEQLPGDFLLSRRGGAAEEALGAPEHGHRPACGAGTHLCGDSTPACGAGTHLCGHSTPACGAGTHLCGHSTPPCGAGTHLCGHRAPACGAGTGPCGHSAPACGAGTHLCGHSAPACGAGTHLCGHSAPAPGQAKCAV
uniref:Uncharacterized protein n=1 Tax=Geospiza parvula TaxID=87175 RepID=A0A8U8C3E6_GEOPR